MHRKSALRLGAACVAGMSAALLAPPARAAEDIVLHSFTGGADGAYPTSPLIDVGGLLYGTSAGNSGSFGTVFSITTGSAESVLHDFAGATSDGATPNGGLVNVNGTLYGTTTAGGAYGSGSVFAMTPGGATQVIYSFGATATDGNTPTSTLINVSGKLYGTTSYGGVYGKGTVFSITTAGVEKVMHSFGSGSDGAVPTAGLLNANNKLYGTTEYGGLHTGIGCVVFGCGTIFTITTAGTYVELHEFTGGSTDGVGPYGSLAYVQTTVYGTTLNAGASNWGTVFQVTKAGVESVLHSFSGASDGANPVGGLLNFSGVLYGTTSFYGPHGGGTVFSMTTAGVGTVLYSFGATETDGNSPNSSLLYFSGRLYGTTVSGGAYNLGTVFSVAK